MTFMDEIQFRDIDFWFMDQSDHFILYS